MNTELDLYAWKTTALLLQQKNEELIAHTESQDARIEALEAECARWIPYPKQMQQERDKWFGLGHIEVVDGQKYLLALPLPLPKPPTPATAPLVGEGAKCSFCDDGTQAGWTDQGGTMHTVPETCDHCNGTGKAPLPEAAKGQCKCKPPHRILCGLPFQQDPDVKDESCVNEVDGFECGFCKDCHQGAHNDQ